MPQFPGYFNIGYHSGLILPFLIESNGVIPMGTVYILKSESNGKYYIGSTNDWVRRESEHNRGHSKFTKEAGPFKLVFKQDFETLLAARKIELKLKKFKSRRIIDKIIEDGFIKMGW